MTTPTLRIEVEAATLAHAEGLAGLFRAAGSTCHCRFWHFDDTNNAWLDRCANAPDENRREFEAALASGSDEARGVVAIARGGDAGEAGRVVGWLKVAPVGVMRKAYDRRFYKRLPILGGDRAGVFLIGCALVDPAYRHRGVATELVAGAVRLAPTWGARALEALPRVPKETVTDEELWMGPLRAFEANGFAAVATGDFDQYPVLRRDLG